MLSNCESSPCNLAVFLSSVCQFLSPVRTQNMYPLSKYTRNRQLSCIPSVRLIPYYQAGKASKATTSEDVADSFTLMPQ
jgi:hypothetical protein